MLVPLHKSLRPSRGALGRRPKRSRSGAHRSRKDLSAEPFFDTVGVDFGQKGDLCGGKVESVGASSVLARQRLKACLAADGAARAAIAFSA
jgi:hypothetical protein